ncbi:unnamed protein product [Rhodiola kirilowii]
MSMAFEALHPDRTSEFGQSSQTRKQPLSIPEGFQEHFSTQEGKKIKTSSLSICPVSDKVAQKRPQSAPVKNAVTERELQANGSQESSFDTLKSISSFDSLKSTSSSSQSDSENLKLLVHIEAHDINKCSTENKMSSNMDNS